MTPGDLKNNCATWHKLLHVTPAPNDFSSFFPQIFHCLWLIGLNNLPMPFYTPSNQKKTGAGGVKRARRDSTSSTQEQQTDQIVIEQEESEPFSPLRTSLAGSKSKTFMNSCELVDDFVSRTRKIYPRKLVHRLRSRTDRGPRSTTRILPRSLLVLHPMQRSTTGRRPLCHCSLVRFRAPEDTNCLASRGQDGPKP